MFYGDEKTDGVVGAKRKNGTNYSFRYMTVDIVTRRYVLYLVVCMKIAIFAVCALLLFPISFAACEFNASKAIVDANERLGWYRGHQNATLAKLLLNGKRVNITIDGTSYYARYKDEEIMQIEPGRTEYSVRLSSCTAVGIWNGSISGKTALNKGACESEDDEFL